jgi:hypothetical protein
VFSFGNLVGETGDGGAPLRVDAADVVATRAALPAAGVGIDSPFDHDRDGRVNARDLAAVRANFGRSLAPPPVAVPSSMRSGVTRDRPTSRPPWDATLLGDAK